ncbi:MAG: phosphatidylglycerophosphatase A [Alphaproteobacteria bacterium]
MILRDQIATVWGVGHTIYMPGTAASLLAFSLAMLAISAAGVIGYWLIWVLTAIILVVGFKASSAYSLRYAKWDPPECVIDEFAAVMLIACVMPLYLPSWFTALIVFRTFDIWKPYPITEIEKLMEPGPRIMLDDILAAVPAIASGWLVYFISLFFIGI